MALEIKNEVVALLRASKTIPAAKQGLMERFGLTDAQASAIVAMRLGQLTNMEQVKIEEEPAQLQERIAELQGILADHGKVLSIIKEEITAIKNKFGDERRTEIAAVSGEMDIEDLIPVEDCVITLTHYGYIKRQPMDVYRQQRRGGRGVSGMTRRDEDFVEEMFVCSTHDHVMFFTSKGKVFRLKAYEIGESSRASRGTNVINLLPLEEGEKITAMIRADLSQEYGYLVMVTTQGIVKRTKVEEYRNVRKSGLIAINLDEGDRLGWVCHTDGSQQVLVATREGMAICFDENDARAIGRTARGVKALDLQEGDEVVGVEIPRENATLLTVSDRGLGRRTPLSEYRLQNRGGKGIRNYYTDRKNGKVAGIKMVDEEDDVILITDDGIIIRIPAADVAVQSRYGGGVRTMRVEENSRVVTLARVPRESEEADASSDASQEETEETEN